MSTGRIASIQRSSYHDGPGLRTTVFFKGCQLRCPWCHNPETISTEIETLFYPEKCIHCGGCAEGCFSGARETVGRDMTVEDILREIREDTPFYGVDGGATFSGGEPLLQKAFLLELIEACHAENVGAAFESNLCFPQAHAEPVLNEIDLLMGDIKIWDEERHKAVTGMSNAFTKVNFRRAAELGKPVIIRTPVIPSVNDDPAGIRATAEFAASLKTILYYELLSYHPLGMGKARALGIEQPRYEKPSKMLMNGLRAEAEKAGVRVLINGREGEI